MSGILWLADERGARVVFSGDTRQIQSVEACDALRILEEESRLKSNALAFVTTTDSTGLPRGDSEIASRSGMWIREAGCNGGSPGDCLPPRRGSGASILDGFRDEVVGSCGMLQRTTRLSGLHRRSVRTKCRQDGLRRAQLTRDVPLNWTAAQKGDSRNFSTGRCLDSTARSKALRRTRRWRWFGWWTNPCWFAMRSVRNARSQRNKAKSFDIYERRSIEVATGDQLLLT